MLSPFAIHALDAVLDDDGDLVRERRVVRQAVRHRPGEQVALTVLVLQPLARQRGPAGGPAEQEAAHALIGGRPDQVADALKAEHRIVDEERDRVDAVGGVRGSRGDERRHRPGFGDPLFQNLPVLRFLVIKEGVHVDRLVHLPGVRVDPDGTEERLHPERARLVRNDWHDQVADFLVAQELREHPHEHHRRRGLAPLGALVELLENRLERRLDRLDADHPGRDQSAERLPALPQVLHLRRIVGRAGRRVPPRPCRPRSGCRSANGRS